MSCQAVSVSDKMISRHTLTYMYIVGYFHFPVFQIELLNVFIIMIVHTCTCTLYSDMVVLKYIFVYIVYEILVHVLLY